MGKKWDRNSAGVLVRRVVSGGQTGADRGGLDAAIKAGLEHGGWCPLGRKAEDGVVPARYKLTETESPSYPLRTVRNVRESDGTILFTSLARPLSGGSLLTLREARKNGKSVFWLRFSPDFRASEATRFCAREDRSEESDLTAATGTAPLRGLVLAVRHWLVTESIRTLNVAGSRESQVPGIAAAVRDFLLLVLPGGPFQGGGPRKP